MKDLILEKDLLNDLSLEELLEGMKRFGKPRLSFMGDGWHCCIDIYVNTKGCSFEVKSKFGCKTAISSVIECCNNMISAAEKVSSDLC